MSRKIISAAIQLVPLTNREQGFPLIDAAIEHIMKSGLHYKVTAFETQIEGPFDRIQQLVVDLQELHAQSAVPEILLYVKYHIHQHENQHLSDKTKPFEEPA